jgi:ssDNA-binding Zn-finger/Zn-ribbon topoisomerase 1
MKIEVYCKVCKVKEELTRIAESKAKKLGFVLCEKCGMPMVIKRIKDPSSFSHKKNKIEEEE